MTKCYKIIIKGGNMEKDGKMVSCDVCGKEFYLNKYRLNRSQHHFCSNECYYNYERPHKKEEILSIYRVIRRNGKNMLEHRFVVEKQFGVKLTRNQYVHHKNGNKIDNRIENLEIMTPIEHNRTHKEKLPKIKICIECGKEFEPPISHRKRNIICSKECWLKHQKKVSPFQNKKISSYKNGHFVKTYNSIKDASEEFNGYSTNIVKCLKGKIKSAYGYQWKYD